MAFKVSDYGNGSLGDVDSVIDTINSYACVTAVSGNTVTINNDTKIDGTATFAKDAKILLHVSAAADTEKIYLGKYLLATVTAVSSNVLTLNQNVENELIPADELAKYHVQAVAVAQFKNLTLGAGTTVTPPIYSTVSFHGGIVALMCSEKLTFDGGHIALTDRGIPTSSAALRPIFAQETAGTDDLGTYSGWENDCSRKFPLNCGDGAAFIVAKEMTCHTDSRIGNVATFGVQFYRGSANSVTYNEAAPSNVTNVGGSSIFIAAETINDFTPKMIAKYRAKGSAAGAGICRCYIASETKLRNDEGLYAYDCISKPNRVIRDMNIKNYGNGSFGDLNNVTTQVNNYATVTAIDGNKVTYKDQTTNGLAQISAGALVMIHWNHKDSTNVEDSGRFFLAKVLSDNGTILTLDTDLPAVSPTNYACQVVAIPQANNFILSTTNAATPKFNGAQGGIFAIAVKNNCDISGGIINVVNKGGGAAYGRNGLAYIGNAQDSNKLPIGQGNGSVFILTKNLTMNASTRIGGTVGGESVFSYRGKATKGSGGSSQVGSGAVPGFGKSNGGYGSNSSGYKATVLSGHDTNWMSVSHKNISVQGSHILIVADTITRFSQHVVATGADGICAGYSNSVWAKYDWNNTENTTVSNSYNGGGVIEVKIAGNYDAYLGSGSSGWAFIYCNKAVDQNTAGTTYDN